MANNYTNDYLYQSVEALKRENKSLLITLTEVVEYIDRDHGHYKDFLKSELSKKYDISGN
tara:strand:+ start:360 stop:539 length:180 start_codon:yes stop_codon:yes gene_type:complete